MKDLDGKQGFAPCGHVGVCVIGNYYKCLVGCDEKLIPEPAKEETTQPIRRIQDDDFYFGRNVGRW